ncbi:hypothetical protein CYLTODRAFT_426756 [Cylindrobasidium torrendii FP15055 ss-10]|uniref:Uncharacterized protein n=1 Tax=Cylindrobasidium torrendii FP15055 ss-10 TaxID=1314674 RepID=A0A0D7AZD3_9AGAR|nr:hypothetical protein CYLTODRAFT_426756 [Cylindrobasidium torrendii FP15055 ss-10]
MSNKENFTAGVVRRGPPVFGRTRAKTVSTADATPAAANTDKPLPAPPASAEAQRDTFKVPAPPARITASAITRAILRRGPPVAGRSQTTPAVPVRSSGSSSVRRPSPRHSYTEPTSPTRTSLEGPQRRSLDEPAGAPAGHDLLRRSSTESHHTPETMRRLEAAHKKKRASLSLLKFDMFTDKPPADSQIDVPRPHSLPPTRTSSPPPTLFELASSKRNTSLPDVSLPVKEGLRDERADWNVTPEKPKPQPTKIPSYGGLGDATPTPLVRPRGRRRASTVVGTSRNTATSPLRNPVALS